MAVHTKHGPRRQNARVRLLDTAVDVIRARGLSATTVDQLCAAAGVTKGAFFHHFETKEALAVEAARYWTRTTGELFAAAEYHQRADPAERVLGYLDLRAALIDGQPEAFTCLAGTMVQEAYGTSPAVRDACRASMFGHAASLEDDLAAALHASGFDREVGAGSLAAYIQAVLQGAFVMSKAANDPAVARDCIAHLRRYVESLIHQPTGV